MLEFIRKIFKEEQKEKQLLEIPLSDMDEWISEKAKPLTEEIDRETNEILMKIDEELQKTRFNLDILENAKLQNPNIPFKAKQYMEGNRAAYIKSVSSFLGHMEINNRQYHYLLEFSKNFDALLDELGKSTLRSYSILQEFFANESGKIAANIKQFDLLFKELKMVLNDTRMSKFNNIKENIGALEARSKQKMNVDVEFRNAEASMKISAAEKESIMAEIENFNQSNEHNEFLKLKEQKKEKVASFMKEQDLIFQSFSLLERPLRKYSHIAFQHEELVINYLRDPILALAGDKEMKILDVLSNLERMLGENAVSIDEKKKEKSLDEIKKLNREFFASFLKKYYSFKYAVEELDKKIESSGVGQRFKRFNSELAQINQRIERTTEEYKKAEEDSQKINASFSNLISEIQDSIREVFNEEVKIIV